MGIRKFRGDRFDCRGNSLDVSIIRETYVHGQYDMLELRETDRWLDVGAHIGVFCVFAAPRVTHIEAYEPEPGNYAVLLRNLELNGIGNVVTHNRALVGNQDRERTFYVNAGKNQSCHSFDQAMDSMHPTTVRCANFPDALAGMDGLKLDAEGAEWELVRSIEDWGKVRQAAIEFHPVVLPGKHDAFAALLDEIFDDVAEGAAGAKGCTMFYCRRDV